MGVGLPEWGQWCVCVCVCVCVCELCVVHGKWLQAVEPQSPGNLTD